MLKDEVVGQRRSLENVQHCRGPGDRMGHAELAVERAATRVALYSSLHLVQIEPRACDHRIGDQDQVPDLTSTIRVIDDAVLEQMPEMIFGTQLPKPGLSFDRNRVPPYPLGRRTSVQIERRVNVYGQLSAGEPPAQVTRGASAYGSIGA